MKIGIDISQIVYRGTGVASYTKFLVEGFSRIDKDNQFILFGSSLRNKKLLKEFLKEFDKNKFKRKISSLPPKFLEFLWNGIHLFPIENLIGEVDVFHSSDWLEPPARSAKKVTTIHDFAVFKYPQTFSARGGHDIVANQKRKLFFAKRECDLIICVSQTTKQDAMEILKIPEKKLRVVYEAPETMYFPRGEEQIKRVMEKFGVKDNYLLCVGTREPRKNLDRAIMAFAEIASKYPELSLLIAGKYGWGEDNSKFKIQNSKLESKVKLLGFVEQEDLAALYSRAEAFVYPSLYEGFGLPILDAMSCGAPVVTSNVGSMKEVAGESAVLIDPESVDSIAEGVLKILKNASLRNELKAKGLKRSGEFSWDKTALQTLNVYHSLADK